MFTFQVQQDSPALNAGLEPFFDFILSIGHTRLVSRLMRLKSPHEKKWSSTECLALNMCVSLQQTKQSDCRAFPVNVKNFHLLYVVIIFLCISKFHQWLIIPRIGLEFVTKIQET